MLIINEDLWEKDRIIKICCSNQWDEKDDFILNGCVLKRLKDLLIETSKGEKKCILLCDCNKGHFPPMVQALQIVAFMVSIKEQIKLGLSYTIVYVKSNDHKNWITNILKYINPKDLCV